MEGLLGLLPFVAIIAIFWLLIIRPQQRRQRQTMQLQAAIEVGDEVMLTSGFFGTVVALREDRADIEFAPGVVMSVMRAAIASRTSDEASAPYEEVDEFDEVDETDDMAARDDVEHPRLEKRTTDPAPGAGDDVDPSAPGAPKAGES